jgi:RNA polymerase sigma-70 factor (ECF subfamily)
MGRYADGDDDKLANVYDLSAPQLCSFLTRLCRDRALAEDLTHETFMRVHRARGAYRRGAPVLPWMFAIGRRLFLDHVRSGRHEGPSLDARSADGSPKSDRGLAAPGPAADEMVIATELAAHIERVLGAMPETQATAFRLLKQERLSITDAAAILGTTEMTVKLRAHRAYVALREVIGHEWDVGAAGAGRRSKHQPNDGRSEARDGGPE